MVGKMVLTVVLVWLTVAFATTKHHSKPKEAQPMAASSVMALSLDSIFTAIKKDFDDVAASSVVKGKDVSAMNGHFFKILKEHQPFYSFTRVGPKGEVVSEVIRMVEKPDTKKRNLSKEPWVRQTLKKQAEFAGMVKLEETGRYYVVLASPVMGKDKKGRDAAIGAVALKIDMWDCFHKYANTTETPFLIRLGKLHLYSNKWKDSIAWREEALSITGVKKISIRFPKVAPAPSVAPVAVAAPAPAPAVDSARIKATQDSLKAVQTALTKQQKQKKSIVTVAIIVLFMLLALLLFLTVPLIRQRIVMGKIDKGDEL